MEQKISVIIMELFLILAKLMVAFWNNLPTSEFLSHDDLTSTLAHSFTTMAVAPLHANLERLRFLLGTF